MTLFGGFDQFSGWICSLYSYPQEEGPLFEACKDGHLQTAEFLLKNGASVESPQFVSGSIILAEVLFVFEQAP